MWKAKEKANKIGGITLVALVVTIVVLLILAGITIVYVFGDNGVFQKAQDAKDAMEKAKEEEKAGLDDINNWIESNLRVSSKKTPIKVEEEIVAVKIEITVNGIQNSNKIMSEEECIKDMQQMLKGKSTQEKETLVEEILRYQKEVLGEELPYEPSIEAMYKYYEVTSLKELALKEMGLSQEEIEEIKQIGFEEIEDFFIARLLAKSPYYEITENVIKKAGYVIIPPEGLKGVDGTYIATKNGEYNFKVKVFENLTQKEIPVKVIVDEIATRDESTRKYEIISDYSKMYFGLRNKETNEYATFEKAYVIYQGKDYNVSEVIEVVSEEDRFNYTGNYNGPAYSVMDDWDFRRLIAVTLGVYPNEGEAYTLMIEKENECYIVDSFFSFRK